MSRYVDQRLSDCRDVFYRQNRKGVPGKSRGVQQSEYSSLMLEHWPLVPAVRTSDRSSGPRNKHKTQTHIKAHLFNLINDDFKLILLLCL